MKVEKNQESSSKKGKGEREYRNPSKNKQQSSANL